MTAFYGGRAECRIRRTPVPVAYVDFTSMYPTVNGLLRLWDVLTAADVEIVDATESVRASLVGLGPARVFDPGGWPSLRGFALVAPEGGVLPTRAAYDGHDSGWQIGVNRLTSARPLWYALPDVVGSTLLTGRPPRVLEAFRLEPAGALAGMRRVELRGSVEVDPRTTDFFRAVIEERARLHGADKALSDFLKVLANATSYGIFAETVRHELPAGESFPVEVHGLAAPRSRAIAAPEEPGAYAFPPIAALLTSAARLMLALLERSVADAGGTYVMVDTDSMAIVATEHPSAVACRGGRARTHDGREAVTALSWTEVDRIRRRFDRLNPYGKGAVRDLLKLEDHNFAPRPPVTDAEAVDRSDRRQLLAYAISAKRYVLFNADGDDVLVRKASEHGLGHLLNPDDPDDRTGRAWIASLWRKIVRASAGHEGDRLPFGERPAVTRTTASAPRLLRPFREFNERRPATEQIRPFNFLLSATVARLGHPPQTDPSRFHLIGRYERDPTKWLRMRWVERYSGRTYPVTVGPASGETVRLKSVADVAAEYAMHPERKSLGPDGRIADRATVGLLGRRRAVAGRHRPHPGNQGLLEAAVAKYAAERLGLPLARREAARDDQLRRVTQARS